MATALAPEVKIEWVEDISSDPTYTSPKRIHDSNFSLSDASTNDIAVGAGSVNISDASTLHGGERLKFVNGDNTEVVWVTYKSSNTVNFEPTTTNSHLTGTTIEFDADNLIEVNITPTNNSMVGEAEITVRHFCVDSTEQGTWFGVQDGGNTQGWENRQIQIIIDNGTATKVIRTRIINYEDTFSTDSGWSRTLSTRCVGGEVLAMRQIVPTNWADKNINNPVQTGITLLKNILLDDDEQDDMPSYTLEKDMFNDGDETDKFVLPSSFDLSKEKMSKYELIQKLFEHVGDDKLGKLHEKQYQFTISYDDPLNHNHGLVEFAHAGAADGHTNHGDDELAFPTSSTEVIIGSSIASTNNVISMESNTYDGERIINKYEVTGTTVNDSWTDRWYDGLNTYLKGGGDEDELTEDFEDVAGEGSNVSIVSTDEVTYPYVLFDMEVSIPSALSDYIAENTFFGYEVLDLNKHSAMSFALKDDQTFLPPPLHPSNKTTHRIYLTDTTGNVVQMKKKIRYGEWTEIDVVTGEGVTIEDAGDNSEDVWVYGTGDDTFDWENVRSIKFEYQQTGFFKLDNLVIDGLPLKAIARDLRDGINSETTWGLREPSSVKEEAKQSNQLKLVLDAVSRVKRTLTPLHQLKVTIPIAPDVTPINKVKVTIPDSSIGTETEFKVMEVTHNCSNSGFTTELVLEPLEGSDYPSDVLSTLLATAPLFGVLYYINKKVIDKQSSPEYIIGTGGGGGGGAGNYVSKTGDTMTGDLKIYNGLDLSLYSDTGLTQKFIIDGATGNTDIEGGVIFRNYMRLYGTDGGDLNIYSDDGSTSKFGVDSATGNTTIAGTLDVTGALTAGSLSISSFSISDLDVTGTSTTPFNVYGGSGTDYLFSVANTGVGKVEIYNSADFEINSGLGGTEVFTVDGATGTIATSSSTKVSNLQADSVDGAHFVGIVKVQGASASTANDAGVATLSWPESFSGTPKVQYSVNSANPYIGVLSSANTEEATVTVYMLVKTSTLTSVGSADSSGASHTHSISSLGALVHNVTGAVTGESGHTHTDTFSIANHAAHNHDDGTYATSSDSPADPHSHTVSSGTSGVWGAIAHTLSGSVGTSSGHTHTDSFGLDNHAVHDHGGNTGTGTASHTHTLSGFGTGDRVTGWDTVTNGILVTALAWE